MAHGRFQGLAGVTGEVSAGGRNARERREDEDFPVRAVAGRLAGHVAAGRWLRRVGGASGWFMFGIGLHNGFVW